MLFNPLNVDIVPHFTSNNITVQLILYTDVVSFNVSAIPRTSITFNKYSCPVNIAIIL